MYYLKNVCLYSIFKGIQLIYLAIMLMLQGYYVTFPGQFNLHRSWCYTESLKRCTELKLKGSGTSEAINISDNVQGII